ncbi:hypothetical protein QBC44DRAFT_48346 [Cladorrhinum sp. PSN332]|nr:hypothetical protein QBC44DRAFT_48346 [Cladorrhinum sp. PSN332]
MATTGCSTNPASSSTALAHHDVPTVEASSPFQSGLNNLTEQQNEAIRERDRTIQELRRLIEEQEQQRQSVLDELINTQLELRQAPTLDDKELASRWKSLEYQIVQLIKRSYNYRGKDPIDQTALATILDGFCERDVLLGLANRRERLHLLEAYIWSVLVDKVFGVSVHIWAGQANRSLSKLRLQIEDYASTNLIDQREYMLWLSRTCTMMGSVYGNEKECSAKLGRIARNLRHDLMPFQKPSQTTAVTAEKDLRDVVTAACDLDFQMTKSSAHYKVIMYDVQWSHMPLGPSSHVSSQEMVPSKFGMAFVAENMEDTSNSAESAAARDGVVCLIRSPAVVKYGTGLGPEFGLSSTLVRSKVICHQSASACTGSSMSACGADNQAIGESGPNRVEQAVLETQGAVLNPAPAEEKGTRSRWSRLLQW